MYLTMLLTAAALLFSLGPAVETTDVVLVEVATGHGSGIVISSTAVLTAAHVTAGATNVRVTPTDGPTVTGTVTHVDAAADLALVELDDALPATTPVSFSAELPTAGQDVFAIGYAVDRSTISVSRGIVSAIRQEGSFQMVQTDAAVNSGMSGGPLLKDDGELVGMVVSKLDGAEGIGLAVSAQDIQAFLADDRSPPAPANGTTAPDQRWFWAALAIPVALLLMLARTRSRGVKIRLGEVRTRQDHGQT